MCVGVEVGGGVGWLRLEDDLLRRCEGWLLEEVAGVVRNSRRIGVDIGSFNDVFCVCVRHR